MLLRVTDIDIDGISVQVIPIELEDSTDIAHLLTFTDGFKTITITISYGRITDETIRCNIDKQ
jgi:hypothetical protein